jgi:membrane-associated phospholipid phosphatase
LAVAFLLLTAAVVGIGSLPGVDDAVRGYFTPVPGSGAVHRVVAVLSMGASAQVGTGLLAVVGVAVALARRSWRPVVIAGMSMVALTVAVFGIKLLVDQVRTPVPVVDPEPAYPSGHAATALVAYGVTVLLLAGTRSRANRWTWAVVAGYATFVGIGRLYLGQHWASDVIAGWLLGLLIVCLVAQAQPRSTPSRAAPVRRTSTFAAG